VSRWSTCVAAARPRGIVLKRFDGRDLACWPSWRRTATPGPEPPERSCCSRVHRGV